MWSMMINSCANWSEAYKINNLLISKIGRYQNISDILSQGLGLN